MVAAVQIPITSDEQWHRLRAACVVTASTVGALLAPHPYETPLSIFSRAKGQLEPIEESDVLAAGQDAELMMPARVKRIRPDLMLVKENIFYYDDKLRFGATPDFVDIGFNGNWQGKCIDPFVFARDWGDEPPVHVLLQHQAEYMMTGRTYGGIVPLVRDRKFSTYVYEIEPHEKVMRAIEQAVVEMRERIANNDAPPPSYPADSKLIESLYKHAQNGKIVDRSGDYRLGILCSDYLGIEAEIDAAKDRLAKAKADLLIDIGDASKIVCGGIIISAPEIGPYDGKTITADLVGTIVGARKGYRRFDITQKKESI